MSPRLLGDADAAAMAALGLACPIRADFTFCFDRRPDALAWPRAVFERADYAGADDGGGLVGQLLFAYRRGWDGARLAPWLYVGDARVHPRARGRHLAADLFADLLPRVPAEVELGLALVKRGNRSAEHIVDTGTMAGFRLERGGALVASNLLVLARLPAPGGLAVRRGRPDDLPDLAGLLGRAHAGRLFAAAADADALAAWSQPAPPALPPTWLVAERGARLVGCLALVDQTPLRRTLLLELSAAARALALAHRAARLVLRRAAPLPAAGEPIVARTAARIAAERDEPAILRALLAGAVAELLGSGVHMLHVGLAGADPLLAALARWPAQRFVSELRVATRVGSPDAAARLGGRAPVVELEWV